MRTPRTGGVVAIILAATIPLPAVAQTARALRAEAVADVNAAMGLERSTIVPVAGAEALRREQPGTIGVTIDGAPVTIDLVPHSVRAPGYAVYHVGDDGVPRAVAPGPVNTFRGWVRDVPEARFAGALQDDGLHAVITWGDGERTWIEPLQRRLDGPFANDYVVYHNADIIPSGAPCATVDDRDFAGADGDEFLALPLGGVCDQEFTAELACDADFPYFQDWGGGTEDRINSVINAVNTQYEDEVDITHVITAIVVRTSSAADPYSTNDAGTLLDQFRTEWLQNQGSIQRDVAHLFTGRNLNGGTIGIAATIGGICTTSAYCLSQSDCCGSFGCATDLTAHELGHLWGGFHCSCTNPDYTMNPFITCANTFSTGSRTSIAAHRNSRTCLDGPPQYCSAGSSDADGVRITRVTLGSLDNPSAGSTYSDFSCLSTTVEKGGRPPVTIELAGADASTIGGLWVDWNRDLDFDDVGETLTSSLTGPGPHVVNLDAPGGVGTGSIRMRLRVQSGGSPAACGFWLDGEVEDYTIDVVDAVPPPDNDQCAQATVVADGVPLAFSNAQATTDGPSEPFSCTFDGDADLRSDVWFTYTAPCTSLVTVDLCASAYDTKVAVYEACPFEVIPVLACNDDACGAGGSRSSLFFGAIEGTTYVIRVGGSRGAQGDGTLLVAASCAETTGACCQPDGSCAIVTAAQCATTGGTYQGDFVACNPCPPPCPADIDGDDEVGFNDLVTLLSAWGPCVACPSDLDGDDVVGFSDLVTLLSAWGPCG